MISLNTILYFKKKYQRLVFLAICLFSVVNVANSQTQIDTTLIPKNIILLIGDGMGLAQIYATMTSQGPLNIEQFPVIGLSKTYSANNYITDSGAGGTAIACGIKTKNNYIGVDTTGKPVKSILEYAEDNGFATGLIATSSITHATPASFMAHCINRNNYEEIARDLLYKDIDVIIGGGRDYFEYRTDKRNYLDSLRKKNYLILNTLENTDTLKCEKLTCFTAKNHNRSILEGRGGMLARATRCAINILGNHQKGFFLMVEGSMIDWGGHSRKLNYVMNELKDFDTAVGVALDFAKKDGNTLVIVTADHETGGLSLVGGSVKNKKVIGFFASGDHTAVMVPLFAFGPGSDKFAGIYENTEIFNKMMSYYGFIKK